MKKSKEKIVIKSETKNRLMIAAASICLLTGIYGASITMANYTPGNREGLIEMLSAKFNLDENEVEKTLDEYRLAYQAERQVEMKIRLEERLNQAIVDGKITEEQKNLLLEKREEMQSKISQDVEGWSEDREARHEKMESYREEMKEWAESNGIDTSLVGLDRGEGRGKGGQCMGKF